MPVGATVSGKLAFTLYERDGFPVDLLVVMAEEEGRSVDVAGFEAALEAAREMSRAAARNTAADGSLPIVMDANDTDYLTGTVGLAPTDDSSKYELVKQLQTNVAADTTVALVFDPNAEAALACAAPVATRFSEAWSLPNCPRTGRWTPLLLPAGSRR